MAFFEGMNTEVVCNGLELSQSKWYSDPTDVRCPHDSWVDKIEIYEKSLNKSDQTRQVGVSIHLLNAFHSGYITLRYTNVISYSLTMLRLSQRGNRAHGDWLEDKLGFILESGFVFHQIWLSSGATICIVCEDMRYEASWDAAKFP